MRYVRNKDLGYNPKGVVAVSIKAAQNKQQVATLTNDLKAMTTVESVSAVQSIPGDIESGRSVRKLVTDKNGYPVKTCHTDGGIVKTMQLQLLAGTTLPQTLAETDTACYVLINEAVMKYLGYKTAQEAVGKYVGTEMLDKAIITGVVRDFNYKSLRDEIGGYVYYTMNKAPESLRTLLIRYNTSDLPAFMQQVHNVFKNDLPAAAFDYQFLDAYVQNLYTSEQHTAIITSVFSLLAILVACLGLFGLAAFTAEQRTKEIGIRKVLGASVTNIARLLTKDFLKLVVIAVVLATPVTWWLMNHWLMNFNYRIAISWWIFVAAGMMAIVIALFTVGTHAIKVAMTNPVKSLRTE
jgi:putative ABC transport system permease protein